MAAAIPPDTGNSYVRWFLKRLQQKKNVRKGEILRTDEDTSTLPRGDGMALLIFLGLVIAGVVWLVYTITSRAS